MNKETLNDIFGKGNLWGDNDSFFTLSEVEQALLLGAQEACPVAQSLVNKPISEGGRGAEVMRNRYGAIIVRLDMVRNLLNKAGKVELGEELYTPIARNDSEPIGVHDEESIPEMDHTHIYRTPMAYALPRIMYDFEAMGYSGKKVDGLIYSSENGHICSVFLEEAIKDSNTLQDMTAIFVEKVMSYCLGKNKQKEVGMMLRHLIGWGKLREENCYELYRKIFQSLRRHAPKTMGYYYSLSEEELEAYKLVKDSDLEIG